MPPLIATAKERSKVSSPDKLRAKIASQSTSAQHSMEASTSMPAGSALNAVRLSSVTSPSAGVAPILADSAPSALHTHTSHTSPPSAAEPLAASAPTAISEAAAAVVMASTAQAAAVDPALLDALKAARKTIADQEKSMTTMIASADALQHIARLQPTTIEAFKAADVPGFGPTRVERYAEPFVACVKSYLSQSAVGVTPEAGGSSTDATDTGKGAPSSSQQSAAPVAMVAEVSRVEVRRLPPNVIATSLIVTVLPLSGQLIVTVLPLSGQLRYNHYKDHYGIVDGRLEFRSVDDKWAFSYAFKGNFSVRLQPIGGGESVLPDGGKLSLVDAEGERAACGTFSGLLLGTVYTVIVEEDPQLASKPTKTYVAPKGSSLPVGRAVGGMSRGSALVTAELKKLTAAELKEGGMQYRELLAQRDLEDAMAEDSAILGEDSASCSCLYGNPCASSAKYVARRVLAVRTLTLRS